IQIHFVTVKVTLPTRMLTGSICIGQLPQDEEDDGRNENAFNGSHILVPCSPHRVVDRVRDYGTHARGTMAEWEPQEPALPPMVPLLALTQLKCRAVDEGYAAFGLPSIPF